MTTTISNASSLGISADTAVLTLFESLARTTWEWLGQARQLKLSFSEETVTDIAALHIAGAAISRIKVAKTTKKQEKRSGIDWMWFIGNQAQGYIRYAVQAKKMTLDDSKNYSYRIRHQVSGIPGVGFQIEVLERFARRSRAIPLYCFYNSVDQDLATDYWHCMTFPGQPDDFRQMGCTLVPLDKIQLVHQPNFRKDFASIHEDQRSIPWRCLFHPQCVVRNIHSRPKPRQGVFSSQFPQEEDLPTSTPESLPRFLSRDGSVVEFNDVIEELELAGLFDDAGPLPSELPTSDDVDSGAEPLPIELVAIPEFFVVIESEFSQLSDV